jgi:hypothetical protein
MTRTSLETEPEGNISNRHSIGVKKGGPQLLDMSAKIFIMSA